MIVVFDASFSWIGVPVDLPMLHISDALTAYDPCDLGSGLPWLGTNLSHRSMKGDPGGPGPGRVSVHDNITTHNPLGILVPIPPILLQTSDTPDQIPQYNSRISATRMARIHCGIIRRFPLNGAPGIPAPHAAGRSFARPVPSACGNGLISET